MEFRQGYIIGLKVSELRGTAFWESTWERRHPPFSYPDMILSWECSFFASSATGRAGGD